MQIISQLLFAIALFTAGFLFYKKAKSIRRNIMLGKKIDRSNHPNQRLNLMLKVAFGQSKMMVRIIPGLLHLAVYAGFLLINLEVIEIILDGLLGTHRITAPLLGSLYDALIAIFEVFMALVTLACIIFLIRRQGPVLRLKMDELRGFPQIDASVILITEIVLMIALIFMNASDQILQKRGVEHYIQAGIFPVSSLLVPLLNGLSNEGLIFIERTAWWFHILGIFAFLNYLPYSKHLHIILAFPNVYFSKLEPKGQLDNNEAITKEVKLMMDPEADFATPVEENAQPQKFGAKDVFDLNWVQLLNAYTCTECGKCTSVCIANITGKKLSPRKIMMSTRDRLEHVGQILDKNNGQWVDDGKSLLRDYISEEELWACTTCNACAEACPVNIDPVSIIIDLRRYLVMEESKASESINVMFNNIQNNGAPWAFSLSDRANRTQNIEIQV